MAWLISSQETPKIAHFALPLSLSLLLPLVARGIANSIWETFLSSLEMFASLYPGRGSCCPLLRSKTLSRIRETRGATLTRVGKIVQTCSPLEKLRFTKEISRVWKESCSQVLENSLRYVYIRVWFPLRAAFSFVLLFLGDGQLSKLKFSV